MKTKLLIAILCTVLIAGCSGGENSITGSFDNSLSGQILAAGTLSELNVSAQDVSAQAGAPVAGVEVRARGTGAASVSDSNGRFSLIGIPANVELTFTRADGINASAHVDARNNPIITVELQKNSAKVIPSGQSKREIEGTIESVSASEITVKDARTHGPVTAKITTNTIIRHGNTPLSTTDLEENDRVHVRALIESDGSLTALEIKLQNPVENGNGNATQQIEGIVQAISATEITVRDASTHGNVTAKINGDTRIRKGNTDLLWSDIHEQDRVHVKAKKDGADLIAQEIKLQNPA